MAKAKEIPELDIEISTEPAKEVGENYEIPVTAFVFRKAGRQPWRNWRVQFFKDDKPDGAVEPTGPDGKANHIITVPLTAPSVKTSAGIDKSKIRKSIGVSLVKKEKPVDAPFEIDPKEPYIEDGKMKFDIFLHTKGQKSCKGVVRCAKRNKPPKNVLIEEQKDGSGRILGIWGTFETEIPTEKVIVYLKETSWDIETEQQLNPPPKIKIPPSKPATGAGFWAWFNYRKEGGK